MADKIVNNLPVVLQTTAVKNFFENTVEQLYSEANTIALSGFVGKKSGQDGALSGAFLETLNPDRYHYSLSPTVNTINPITGESENLVFYDEFIDIIDTYGVDVKDHNVLFEESYKTFMPPIDVDKFLNFTEYFWSTSGPTAIQVIPTSELNIDKDIIGKKQFTPTGGKAFRNGMKVQFIGDYILPTNKTNIDYIVGGVGESIFLSQQDRTQTTAYGGAKQDYADYIVIERGSYIGSAWSRVNNWFHRDNFLDVGDELPNKKYKAKRPIVEFDKDIELYGYGSKYAGEVDLLEPEFLKADIVGEANYNVDGIALANDMLIVFANEIDDNIKYIYKVSGVGSSIVLSQQTTLAENDSIVIKNGLVYKGLDFIFMQNTFREAQQKTKINQAPLFNLYDDNKVRLNNSGTFLDSTFTGNELFNYKVGTGVNDSVLGFPLAYSQFKSSSEIAFQNYINTERYYYMPFGTTTNTEILGTYYYKCGDDYHNTWKDSPTLSRQKVLTNYELSADDVANKIVEFNVGATPKVKSSTSSGYDILVKLNGKVVTNYTYADKVITFNSFTMSKGDLVDIEVDAEAGISDINSSRYQVPLSWSHNTEDKDISTIASPEFLPHFKRFLESQDNFTGDPLAHNNFASTDKDISKAIDIVSSSEDLDLGVFLLDDQQHNLVDAIRFVGKEYNKYKNRLVSEIEKYIDGLDTADFSADFVLERVLRNAQSFSIGKGVFDTSYILPFGDNFKSEEFDVADVDNYTYTLSNYKDISKLENTVLVFFKGVNDTNERLLLLDQDYSISDTNPIEITILKDSITLQVGDAITTRLYDKDRDSAQCPPTPSTLGMYPLYLPRKENDTSYQTPVEVIVGHDGSRTPTTGSQQDDILLEFEKRLYNSCQKEFRDANSLPIYNVIDIRSGYFRSSRFAWREYHDLIRQNFINWNNANKSDFAINEFYDNADQFTWNYSGGDTTVPGHWRGWYTFYYDTVRPHTHPWEMLGFFEKPTWWNTQYGTDYGSDNKDLWKDLEKGIIRQGSRANVANDVYKTENEYARPGLENLIPVNQAGELLPPAKITNTPSSTKKVVWNNRRVRANDIADQFKDPSNTEFNQIPNGVNITVGSDVVDRILFDEEGWDMYNRPYDGFSGSNVYIKNSNINKQFEITNYTFTDLGDAGLITDRSLTGQEVNLPNGYVAIAVDGTPIVNPKSTTSYNNQGNWNEHRVYNQEELEEGSFVIKPEHAGLTEWATDSHSPIVGFAWDGLPIYGPYGYAEYDPNGQVVDNSISLIRSAFELKAGNRASGPGARHSGQYVEDYTYNSGSGAGTTKPDHNNKRYGVTPESPTTPIWFYVATYSNATTPEFPYHIGGVKNLATDVTYRGHYYALVQDFSLSKNIQGTSDTVAELIAVSSTFTLQHTEKDGSPASKNWKFGDGAPVENAWRYSSHYPFAITEALLLAKPGRFASFYADPTNYIIPSTEQFKIIHPTDRKKWAYKNSDHFRIHGALDSNGDKIVNSGYTQLINSWLEFQGLNMQTDFADKLATINVKLAHRLEGFSDKDTLKVRTDQFSSTGTTKSLLIPDENYALTVHNSPYKSRNFYSGVIVQKVQDGYKVRGFDKDVGYFEAFELDKTGSTSSIEVGGEPADYRDWEPNISYAQNSLVLFQDTFYKAKMFVPSSPTFSTVMFDRLPSLPQVGGVKAVIYQDTLPRLTRIDYGTLFTTYQEVVDFLVGLGRHQESLGYDFGGFDSAINDARNWTYAAQQFVFWVAGGWQNNNTIELSPMANKVVFDNAESFIAKINRIERNQFSLIDQNGRAIQPTECEIIRQDNRVEIVPPADQQIYGCMLFTKQIEHAMIIDNVTDFNDTIYNSLYNQKQNRLRIKGKKTANWTGRFNSSGFIIQGDELKPNLDNMAQSLGRYHELGFIPVEKQLYEKSRGLFGYEERAYLNDLELDDDTQFEFYSGMIREKGTTPSLSKIAKSNAIIQGNMDVYDEWALKIGDFGDLENDQAIELKLARSDIAQDPQLVTLAFPADTTGVLDKVNIVSTSHKYHQKPIIKIAAPVKDPKKQATADATLSPKGEIQSIAVTEKGSGYAEVIGLNVIASEIVVGATEHTFRIPVAQSNALSNSNLVGATLTNLSITDHNANTTLVPGGTITVDLSSATNYNQIQSLVRANPEFANSTLSIQTSTFEVVSGSNNIVKGIVRLTGQDFTLAESGSTLADLNLTAGRYQPKQRYNVISVDQKEDGTGTATSNANIDVQVAGVTVSDTYWNYDHGSRTAIDFRVVGIQASQRVSPTGAVTDDTVWSGNVTFNSASPITNNKTFNLSSDNIVAEENIYDHIDLYIDGQIIENTASEKRYEFTAGNSFIIYDVNELPQQKLVAGSNVYIHEHSTVEFTTSYQGDLPGKELKITVNANDNITSIVKSDRIYTITKDEPGDEVILIDIDDSKKFLKKPTGVKESGLWPTTSNINHTGMIEDKYRDIPNAGYINRANVDYRAWRVRDIDRLFEDRLVFHPERGDLIHVANSENKDWNVYEIKKTDANVEYIEMLPGEATTYLYTDKDLFEYSDFNQINDKDTSRFLDYHLVIKDTDQNHKFCIWTNQDVVSAKQVRITNLTSLPFVEANVVLARPRPGSVYAISNVTSKTNNIFMPQLTTISNNTVRVETTNSFPVFEGDQVTVIGPQGNVNLGAGVDGNTYTVSNVSGSNFTIELHPTHFNPIANANIGFGNGIIDASNVMMTLNTRTVITANDHPYVTGDKVAIEAGGYSGIWKVLEADANTFAIGARFISGGPTTGNVLSSAMTFNTDKDHGLDGFTGKIAIHNFHEWPYYNKVFDVTSAFGNVINTTGIYPHGNSNISSTTAIMSPLDHDVIYPNGHKIKLDVIESADGIQDSFNNRMAITRGALTYKGSFGMGIYGLKVPSKSPQAKGTEIGGRTPYARDGSFDQRGLRKVGEVQRDQTAIRKKGFAQDKNTTVRPGHTHTTHRAAQPTAVMERKAIKPTAPTIMPRPVGHAGSYRNDVYYVAQDGRADAAWLVGEGFEGAGYTTQGARTGGPAVARRGGRRGNERDPGRGPGGGNPGNNYGPGNDPGDADGQQNDGNQTPLIPGTNQPSNPTVPVVSADPDYTKPTTGINPNPNYDPGPARPEPARPPKPGTLGKANEWPDGTPIIGAQNPYEGLRGPCAGSDITPPPDDTDPTDPEPTDVKSTGQFNLQVMKKAKGSSNFAVLPRINGTANSGDTIRFRVYTKDATMIGKSIYGSFEEPLRGRYNSSGDQWPLDSDYDEDSPRNSCNRGFVPSLWNGYRIVRDEFKTFTPFDQIGRLRAGYRRVTASDLGKLYWRTPFKDQDGTVIRDTGANLTVTSFFADYTNGDKVGKGGMYLIGNTFRSFTGSSEYKAYCDWEFVLNDNIQANGFNNGAVATFSLSYDEGVFGTNYSSINALNDQVGKTWVNASNDAMPDSNGNYYNFADLIDSKAFITILPKADTPDPEPPKVFLSVTGRTNNSNDSKVAVEGVDTFTATVTLNNYDTLEDHHSYRAYIQLQPTRASGFSQSADVNSVALVNSSNYGTQGPDWQIFNSGSKKGKAYVKLTKANPTAKFNYTFVNNDGTETDEGFFAEIVDGHIGNDWFAVPTDQTDHFTLKDNQPPPADPEYNMYFRKGATGLPNAANPPVYMFDKTTNGAELYELHIFTENVAPGTTVYIRDGFYGQSDPWVIRNASRGKTTITRADYNVFPDKGGVDKLSAQEQADKKFYQLLQVEKQFGDPRTKLAPFEWGDYSETGDILAMYDYSQYVSASDGLENGHSVNLDIQHNGFYSATVNADGTVGPIRVIWNALDTPNFTGPEHISHEYDSKLTELKLALYTSTNLNSKVGDALITAVIGDYPDEIPPPQDPPQEPDHCEVYERFSVFDGQGGTAGSPKTVQNFYNIDCSGKITVTFYNWSVGDNIKVYGVNGKQTSGGKLIANIDTATQATGTEQTVLLKIGSNMNNSFLKPTSNLIKLDKQGNGKVGGAGTFSGMADLKGYDQIRVDLVKYSTLAMYYVDIPKENGKTRAELDATYEFPDNYDNDNWPQIPPGQLPPGRKQAQPSTPLVKKQGQVYHGGGGGRYKTYQNVAYYQNYSGVDTHPNAGHKYLPSALRKGSNLIHSRVLNYGVYIPVTNERFVSLTHQRVSGNEIRPLAPAVRAPIPLYPRKVRSTTAYGGALNSLSNTIANGRDILFDTPRPITIGLPEGIPVYAENFPPDEYYVLRNDIPFEAPPLGTGDDYPGVTYQDPNEPANVDVKWTENPIITIQPKVENDNGVLVPAGKLAYASVYNPTPTVQIDRDSVIGLTPGDILNINGTPVEIKGSGFNGLAESLKCADINGVTVDTVDSTGEQFDYLAIQSCSPAPLTFKEGCSGAGQYKEILDFHITKTIDAGTTTQFVDDGEQRTEGTTFYPGSSFMQPVTSSTDSNGDVIYANTTIRDANGNVTGTEQAPVTTTVYKQVNQPAQSGTTYSTSKFLGAQRSKSTVHAGKGYAPQDRLRLIGGEPVADPFSSIVRLCIENPGANYSYRGMIRIQIGDGTTPGRGASVKRCKKSDMSLFDIPGPITINGQNVRQIDLQKHDYIRVEYDTTSEIHSLNGGDWTGMGFPASPTAGQTKYYEVKQDTQYWSEDTDFDTQWAEIFYELPSLPYFITMDENNGIAEVELEYTETVAGSQVCGVGYNLSQPPKIIVQDLGSTGLGRASAEIEAVLTKKAMSVPRVAKFEVTAVGSEGEILGLRIIDRGIYRQLPADLDSGLPLEYDYILEGDIDDGVYLRQVRTNEDAVQGGAPLQPRGSGLGQWDPLNQYKALTSPSRTVRDKLGGRLNQEGVEIPLDTISGTQYNTTYSYLGDSHYASKTNTYSYTLMNGATDFTPNDVVDRIVETGASTYAIDINLGSKFTIPLSVPPVNTGDDWGHVKDLSNYGKINWSSNTGVLDGGNGNYQANGGAYRTVAWVSELPGGTPIGNNENYICFAMNSNYYNHIYLINDDRYWNGQYTNGTKPSTKAEGVTVTGGVQKKLNLHNPEQSGSEARFVNFALVYNNSTTWSDFKELGVSSYGTLLRASPGTAGFDAFVVPAAEAYMATANFTVDTRYPDSMANAGAFTTRRDDKVGYDPNVNAFGGGKGARLYFTSREIPDCSERGTAKQALGLPDIVRDPNANEELTRMLNKGLNDAGHDPRDIRFTTQDINDDVSLISLDAPGYDGIEFGEVTPGFLEGLGIPIGDYNHAMACMVMTNETSASDTNPLTVDEITEGVTDGNGFFINTELKEEILTITCVDNMLNPPGSIFGNANLQFVEDLYKYELRSAFNTPIQSPLLSQQASVNVLESLRYSDENQIALANAKIEWGASNIPEDKDGFKKVWVDNYYADSSNIANMAGFINNGWAYFENGTPKRWQKPMTDPSFIRDVILYDSDTGEREYDIDKWDPFKGVLPAFVDAEIHHIMDKDPVVYNSSRSRFSEENCGQVWWDTSAIKYEWYEQGPNTERWKNWGNAFPGSTIRLYEWVKSDNPPLRYEGTGTPKNGSEYLSERKTDPATGEKKNCYYYWVQNKRELTTFAKEKHLRKFNTFDLAKYLSDPMGQGLNTISFISSGNQTSDNDASFIVGNLPDIIREDEQNLQINLSRNLNPIGLKHVAWKMVREGDPDSIIPEDLSAKLIDSLCEQDATGQVVPASNLSEVEKYGTAFRPRQTMFEYPAEARREMHYVLNEILADLKLETQNPKFDTIVPLGTYINKINWYETIRSDSTNNKIRYDNTAKSLYTVESVRALESIKRDSLFDGAIIMVKGTKLDRFQLWRWSGKTNKFTLIAIENETVKLTDKVYKDAINDILASDIRTFLELLRDQFFVGTNLWNKFFFNMMKYAYGEQPQIDWAFKTSYVYVSKQEEDLTLRQGFTPDNFDSVIEYLNEAKPYSAKVREYKDGKKTPIDYITDQMVSDFDKPPYPDPVQGAVRILDNNVTDDANILASDTEYVKFNSVMNDSDNPIRKGNVKLVFDRVDWRLLPYDFDHSTTTYAQGTAELVAYLNGTSNTIVSANANVSQAGRLFKFDPEVRTQFVEELDLYKSNQGITTDISTNTSQLENAYQAGALTKTLELVKVKVGGGFRGEEIDANVFTKVVGGEDSLTLQTGFGFDTEGFDAQGFDSSIEVRNYEGIFDGNTTLRRSGVTYDGFDSVTFQKVLYGEERPEEMAMFSPLENLVVRVQTSTFAYGNGVSQPATDALALGPYPVTTSNSSSGVVTVTTEYGRLLANTDSLTFAGGSNAINQTFAISNVSQNYSGNIYSNTQFTINLTGYTDTGANVTFRRGNTHVDVEYIVHSDMFGGEQYFRIKGDSSTKTILAKTLESYDDKITVQDASLLPQALPGVPGVIWIDGVERIEYREINTTTNTLTKITRGTRGTTIQKHSSGVSVVSGYYTEDFNDTRNTDHAFRNPDEAIWINTNMLSLTDVTNRTNNDGIAAWLQGDSVTPTGWDSRGWDRDLWDGS